MRDLNSQHYFTCFDCGYVERNIFNNKEFFWLAIFSCRRVFCLSKRLAEGRSTYESSVATTSALKCHTTEHTFTSSIKLSIEISFSKSRHYLKFCFAQISTCLVGKLSVKKCRKILCISLFLTFCFCFTSNALAHTTVPHYPSVSNANHF